MRGDPCSLGQRPGYRRNEGEQGDDYAYAVHKHVRALRRSMRTTDADATARV